MAETNQNQAANDTTTTKRSGGIGGGWIFLIVVIILLLLAFVGWTLFSRLRARRLGLPPPSLNPFALRSGSGYGPAPARGGVVGWVSAKFRALQNKRSTAGAYEPTSASAGRRGNNLDPDEAWDTRVGNEADIYGPGPGGYYEEQELGLRAPTAYHSATSPYGEERGRSRSRDGRTELDVRYDEEMGGAPKRNPFDDQAERSDISSLRGVSPRPMVDTRASAGRTHRQMDSAGTAGSGDSPTERRSMFRENM